MNLLELLSKRDYKTPLFFLENGQVELHQILQMRETHKSVLAAASGQSVALCIKNAVSLVMWIVLLDGVCPSILLVPREADAELVQRILANSNAQSVISDFLTADNCPLPLLSQAPSGTAFLRNDFITEWSLPTSGTTGIPKLIPHTMSKLMQTVRFDQDKGKSLRWGTLYDLGRFAGLQVFLQAMLGGSSLALFDHYDVTLSELITSFRQAGVNALSATPTMWQKIMMTSGSEQLMLRQITLGGEIVRQRVLDALSLKYPGARITHIYASTEFGVGFSVTDRLEGFPSDWLDGKNAIGRIDLDTSELLLRKGEEWFATGDAVAIYGDRVKFQGRINGSINVGGNKVMPEEVEQVLLQYPGVKLAYVSAKKSSFMGNLVQAELVVQNESLPDRFINNLTEYCRQNLDSYKVPAFIKVVDKLSVSSSGKIIRNGECT